MRGSDTTNGLSRNLSSSRVSGTTKTSFSKMALEQKATSRDVSETERPTLDLNHWRFSSTSDMRAMGVRQTYDANSVRSSNPCSGSVSRIAYFCRAARRATSLMGIGATMVDL